MTLPGVTSPVLQRSIRCDMNPSGRRCCAAALFSRITTFHKRTWPGLQPVSRFRRSGQWPFAPGQVPYINTKIAGEVLLTARMVAEVPDAQERTERSIDADRA